ncbi:unnamed protein product [Penicillium salamii]|uniref:DUF7730 domain-containing protein n=1 Tax=Penicillium salamii TaxID=1612424 RepID=A0A9W4I2L8_9EURO|nr:unnamed protein product [Penicillium salamii]CAG8041626.1 unnamed protein product [Penicillium salamii]CAG8065350.1 unnamed protein product [Penicillium salamii]CAG8194085.1 unnamed protein product [Penicillium salamii]CAG8214577.1 unnamed protein product [Penicillium salamii]
MVRMKPGVFSWDDVLAQRYHGNKPPPLPRRSKQVEASQPQSQSRLLGRLSPELRLMIWGYVLGGQRIHIIQRSGKRLGHLLCPCSPYQETKVSNKQYQRRRSDHLCDICHGTGIPQPAKEGEFARSRNKVMLLGLALTCRQIETDIMNPSPCSTVSQPSSSVTLHPTIPRQHWESIRTVELRWSFPGHWLPSKDSVRAVYVSAGQMQWQETCQSLTQMNGLRSFTLALESTWFSESAGKLVGFLDPLKGLAVRSVNTSIFSGTETSPGKVNGSGECYGFVGESVSIRSSEDASPGFRSLSETSAVSGYTTGALAMGWELRLHGQSYYPHELRKIGDDLRQRGIDCWISV